MFVDIHAAWVGGFRKGWADVARLRRLTDRVCILRVKPPFLLWEKWDAFILQLFFACPAGAKTTFSFAPQKKKRFWTPKKKRWTSGNNYRLRYNRTLALCCYGIPRVKDFRVFFCFRRPAFERPVLPFAPLPLSGWNTVTCSLVSTPPGGW